MVDRLALEMEEIHNYIRMMFQTYVAWFTFFITVMFAAIAWTLKVALDEKGNISFAQPLYAVSTLYAIECVLGVVATILVYRNLRALTDRVGVIQTLPTSSQENAGVSSPHNPVPPVLGQALFLMGLTLIVNIGFLVYLCIQVELHTASSQVSY